jgi:DNA polymerase-3 subunit gamma/tau
MTHRVISLKYRPQNFDELTGQAHIVMSLKGAIKTGRIGHAFLFAGPRGVGKTTTARILAKSLNCVEGPTVLPCQTCPSCREITASRSVDVVEIDGASNRGIDEIRNLREGVRYSPLHGRRKIYIIDEVHMLTQEAFNALLKTLEEPPPNVVFVFATTNPTKVPATILSRCQRFVFKRLSLQEITGRLRTIAKKEKIKITSRALHYIAIRADGSIRDGESILEQLVSFVEGEITEKDVFQLVGFLAIDYYAELLDLILSGDLGKVIAFLNRGIEEGAAPLEIYRGFTGYLRMMLLVKTNVSEEFIDLDEKERMLLKKIPLSETEIISMLETCLRFEDSIRRSANSRIATELFLSQLVLPRMQNTSQATQTAPEKHDTSSDALSLLERLAEQLQDTSPTLAGIIRRSEVKKQGKDVAIVTDSDFSKEKILGNRKRIEQILKKVTGTDATLTVEVVRSGKEDDIVNTLKVLFDSEEIR